MLLGVAHIPAVFIPKGFAHGFISLGGEKMSKTRGNILDPRAMAALFGPDGIRYLLLREVPFDKDGDISLEHIVNRYNADLANELGNLFSRTAAMIEKYLGGVVVETAYGPGNELYGDLAAALDGYREHMDRMEFSRALGAFWTIVQRANRFIEEKQPWVLAKDETRRDELSAVFVELLAVLTASGTALSPFMPERMNEMLDWLGTGGLGIDDLPPTMVGAKDLAAPKPLFPRLQGDPEELIGGS